MASLRNKMKAAGFQRVEVGPDMWAFQKELPGGGTVMISVGDDEAQAPTSKQARMWVVYEPAGAPAELLTQDAPGLRAALHIAETLRAPQGWNAGHPGWMKI